MSSRKGRGKEGATKAPSDMPESLYGRINAKEMGTRAGRDAAPSFKALPGALPLMTTKKGAARKLDDYEGISYHPKTQETRQAFDFFIGLVSSLMGADQPENVTITAAAEILEVLKREADEKDLDKKLAIEALIGPFDTDHFMQLVNLGKKITDYVTRDTKVAGPFAVAADEDEDTGVAVVFQEDANDEDEVQPGIVQDSGDEESESELFTLVHGTKEEDNFFINEEVLPDNE